MKNIIILSIGFLILAGCAHRSEACLQRAIRAEMACLQLKETQENNTINHAYPLYTQWSED